VINEAGFNNAFYYFGYDRYVSDCQDKNRCAFLDKPNGERIRIRWLVRTVRQNLEDFRCKSIGVKKEKSGGVVEEGECGQICSGVAKDRQTEVGYFFCDEGSTAVGERDTWSRGR